MSLLTHERKNFMWFLFTRPLELALFLPKFIAFVLFHLYEKSARMVKSGHSARTSKRAILPSPGNNPHEVQHRLNLKKLPEIRCAPSDVTELLPIKLASETIPAQPHIDWEHLYPDRENTFALNRFGWLLAALIERPSANMARQALQWIEHWIIVMDEKACHPAWESYSVAERISNWPFILLIVKSLIPIPDRLLDKIGGTMTAHVNYLLSHIELRGNLTNNHVLNDARGLYIAGLLLNHRSAIDKAKELFTEWTDRLVDADGMLREHSSHYQHLLSQRYEQVYFLSEIFEDQAFQSFIKKRLELMLQSSAFFIISSENNKQKIPLIGDISPDFAPYWFLPSCDHGWAKLKNWLGWEPLGLNKRPDDQFSAGEKNEFIRYDAGDVTIFWHVEANGPRHPNHRHFDVGSFILFKNGVQVFADPGRYSYTREGSCGIGAKAHCSILVDSLGAYCEDTRLNLLNAYTGQRAHCHISESKNQFILEIDVDGFCRLQEPVKWKRRFTVQKEKMLISDVLDSAGKNSVETRFQIAPSFEVQNRNGELAISSNKSVLMKLITDASPARRCVLLGGESTHCDEGWFSEEYGSRASGTTILFQQELHNSQTWSYEVQW